MCVIISILLHHLSENLKNNTFRLFVLVGGFVVNFTATPPVDSIILRHPELAPGGLWAPHDCIPRQRVALIIPFRDREEHLEALLYVLHPFLQRQMLDYTIFVVEQVREPTSHFLPLGQWFLRTVLVRGALVTSL